MNPLPSHKKFSRFFLIGLALFVSLSCLPTRLISNNDPANTVSTTPDNPSQPISPEITPTDPSQQVPIESPSTEQSRNVSGPWLLIESSQGLWAANPDGSGLQQLTTVNYWRGELRQAIQPAGNHVVFVTPGNYNFEHMALNLLSLPDGQITKITDLTSPSTEAYADSGPGDSGFEALRAIGESISYAWSPDGTQLAFSGAMDGPSADIYLYNIQSDTITRVSQDPAQDFAPSWSPDGNHLLYLAAESFGTGAGWAMSGVWTANSTGGNATQLFSSDSGGEEVEGWLNNTTVLLAAWDQPCGLQNLRLINLDTNQTTVLNSDCFNSAAADGEFGTALFSNMNGIYMLTNDDLTPVQVDSAGDATIEHRYPEDQVYTVRFTSGGIATFGSISLIDHQVSPVQATSREMDVASYGAIWGWTSRDANYPGAWITGPGVDIGRIYDDPAILPIWSEDNNLLFFAIEDSGYTLYLTTFDSFYTDLHSVNFIESDPTDVAWLGWD